MSKKNPNEPVGGKLNEKFLILEQENREKDQKIKELEQKMFESELTKSVTVTAKDDKVRFLEQQLKEMTEGEEATKIFNTAESLLSKLYNDITPTLKSSSGLCEGNAAELRSVIDRFLLNWSPAALNLKRESDNERWLELTCQINALAHALDDVFVVWKGKHRDTGKCIEKKKKTTNIISKAIDFVTGGPPPKTLLKGPSTQIQFQYLPDVPGADDQNNPSSSVGGGNGKGCHYNTMIHKKFEPLYKSLTTRYTVHFLIYIVDLLGKYNPWVPPKNVLIWTELSDKYYQWCYKTRNIEFDLHNIDKNVKFVGEWGKLNQQFYNLLKSLHVDWKEQLKNTYQKGGATVTPTYQIEFVPKMAKVDPTQGFIARVIEDLKKNIALNELDNKSKKQITEIIKDVFKRPNFEFYEYYSWRIYSLFTTILFKIFDDFYSILKTDFIDYKDVKQNLYVGKILTYFRDRQIFLENTIKFPSKHHYTRASDFLETAGVYEPHPSQISKILGAENWQDAAKIMTKAQKHFNPKINKEDGHKVLYTFEPTLWVSVEKVKETFKSSEGGETQFQTERFQDLQKFNEKEAKMYKALLSGISETPVGLVVPTLDGYDFGDLYEQTRGATHVVAESSQRFRCFNGRCIPDPTGMFADKTCGGLCTASQGGGSSKMIMKTKKKKRFS